MTYLIVPFYNEEFRINIDSFCSLLSKSNFHLIFVNDCSKDNTISLLNSIKSFYPGLVTILDLDKNNGKSGAIQIGFEYLFKLDQSCIKTIGFMDADFSIPAQEVIRVTKNFSESKSTFIYTSRKNLTNKKPYIRKVMSFLLSQYTRFILNIPLSDTQAGLKLFRNSQHICNCFEKPFRSKWCFDIELYFRLLNNSSNKVNIEINLLEWNYIKDSKLRLIHLPRILLDLFYFYFLSIQKRRN